MKPELRGMVAATRSNHTEIEKLQAEMDILLVTVAGAMKLRESLASGGTAWQFPDIDEWKEHFTTLEDALPLLATLTAAKRYLWWVGGDIAEALLRKFGRTEGVKASIGSAFGCKVRAVEYRAKAAVLFLPEMRYPDVPTELYRETLSWPEPLEVLDTALEDGTNSYQLRTERWRLEGRSMGSPIWRSVNGNMTWEERDGHTTYTIIIVEEGGCRFADNGLPVVISVAPFIGKQLTG